MSTALVDWFLSNGLRILAIVVATLVAMIVIRSIARRAVSRTVAKHGGERNGTVKRAETLTRVFVRTINISVLVIGFAMALSAFGIDVAPIIAGAGIAGLAIGFGAQQLVKDAISGMFILLEDQYRVGDWVAIDAVQGEVEDITLRRTIIRDEANALHTVPNGDVRKLANFSKAHARIQITLPLAYGKEIDRVIALGDRIGQELVGTDLKKKIKQPIVFERVESFGAGSVLLRFSGEAVSAAREEVAGVFRLRLYEALKAEGIATS